mgnify:CR=1 FL=1
MSNLKNINLDIASFAMRCVEEVKDTNDDKNKKKYKTLVRKMFTLIQKNGFIGTLVFNLSKVGDDYHKEVLKDIVNWNVLNYKINHIKNFKDNYEKLRKEINDENDLKIFTKYIEWVTSLNQREYRFVTKEMMNLFGWIKRFADGMIEGEE